MKSNTALTLNTTLSHFKLTAIEPAPDVQSTAYIFTHVPSGARLAWLANDNTNRSFAISFKTPPQDDTGVFHILEHSVLDGSEKYPLKEPFVNLCKSSLKTFLNAFTFFDKTMYPVASTNVDDLENLMDVYLDAVLHPAIYTKPAIFLQEGWHEEIVEDNAGSADDAAATTGAKSETASPHVTINGVVYNEMKGALSDPEDALLMHVKRALFPDSAYQYESGGNPEAIPNLTYEQFLDAHKRHYNLAHASIVLYGDLNIERELAFIDERLTQANQTRSAGEPNPLVLQNPVHPEPRFIAADIKAEDSVVGLASVFGTYRDRKDILAAQILVGALMGSNEAPLKKALLDAEIADDAYAMVLDGILQPFVLLVLKGARPGAAEQAKNIIQQVTQDLITAGIDTGRLEAEIAQATFSLREQDSGYPEGVDASIAIMSSWLYDEDNPVRYLQLSDELTELSETLGFGYFEQLLHRIVASNHQATVSLVPDENTPEQRTASYKAPDQTTIERIKRIDAELKQEQQRQDDPKDIAKIPHLSLSALQQRPTMPKIVQYEAGQDGIPFARRHYDIATNRIMYATLSFDLAHLSYEDLPYAVLLTHLLGQLGTQHHTAEELDTLLTLRLGSFSSAIVPYYQADDPLKQTAVSCVVEASALEENIAYLATLPQEILRETLINDEQRIQTILIQLKVALENNLVNNGHALAQRAAEASFSTTVQIIDDLRGIGFYRFICNLTDSWDAQKEATLIKLTELLHTMFYQNNCRVSLAGSDAHYEAYWKAAGDMGFAQKELVHALSIPQRPASERISRAYSVPSDVTYTALSGAGLASCNEPYHGSWSVAAQALTYTYLWQQVRVLQGAYGAGINPFACSLISLYSYRDPVVEPTVDTFLRAGEWLATWKPTESELEGCIISCIAKTDAPLKPRALMKKYDSLAATGRDLHWPERVRKEILNTSLNDIHAFAEVLAAITQTGTVVSIGSRTLLEQSNLPISTLK